MPPSTSSRRRPHLVLTKRDPRGISQILKEPGVKELLTPSDWACEMEQLNSADPKRVNFVDSSPKEEAVYQSGNSSPLRRKRTIEPEEDEATTSGSQTPPMVRVASASLGQLAIHGSPPKLSRKAKPDEEGYFTVGVESQVNQILAEFQRARREEANQVSTSNSFSVLTEKDDESENSPKD